MILNYLSQVSGSENKSECKGETKSMGNLTSPNLLATCM